MDKTQKMFQTIINGQSAMKSELIAKIGGVEQKLDKRMNGLESRLDKFERKVSSSFKKVTLRIDQIGLAVARLEDDAPTVEEFDKLEKRVSKVEQRVASV